MSWSKGGLCGVKGSSQSFPSNLVCRRDWQYNANGIYCIPRTSGSDFFQISSPPSRRSPTSIYRRPKIPNLFQYLVTSATLPGKERYLDPSFQP
ncbi:uncharacterized protein EAF01_007209 [Botrytis porri]|uniref:uncharacterized protein n=1 Tax=Botrytis porri TaxID=87229 RepID=UPI0019027AB7|nr:uncharacterized protein EAF01_007209 [Botrytis porri]KAF7901911.1 hypothetical protein EAF01_007209 [Botrytis porri]